MTRCDRFEREGLLQREQDRALDDHFATCPDCRRAAAAYERIRAELRCAGAGFEPPPDWQARTWAAIARRQKPRHRRWLWTLVPAGLAVLAGVLLIPRAPQAPLGPSLAVEILPATGVVRRGTEAGRGDQLLLRATTGGAPYAELRVYLNDSELVLACSSEPPCTREDGSLRARFELSSIGTYQSLLLLSDQPLPPSTGGLDGDAGAAIAAGARVELGEAVLVR